jgi:phosphoglycerate dehydrogenase-like enzyme
METVLVTAPPRTSAAIYRDALARKCNLLFLTELAGQERQCALETADILICGHVRNELLVEDAALLGRVRFVQLLHAGVDHIPFSILPKVPISCSRGKGAVEMSEHIAALTLACSRRVLMEDRNMRAGQFNTYADGPRVLSGGICAILGFGGVGQAAAIIFRGMGMSIHAINRSGKTDDDVDFIGTVSNLEATLRSADVIVITMALTSATAGLIGARELAWAKKDAILVNVSRAEIIDEASLYRHLLENPRFSAGLDAWWIEPFRHGEFRTNYPFLELDNVVASPHNSAQANNSDLGLSQTLVNVRAVLDGDSPRMLVHDDEKFL